MGAEKARAAATQIFVTGSYWYAASPMAAGLETLRLVQETDYLEKIESLGERLRAGLAEARRGARIRPASNRTCADAAVPIR